jgi:hypothetical protein
MSQFQLFDAVQLKESILLAGDQPVAAGTAGAIVEILQDGEAFMVELFGGWVKEDEHGDFVPAKQSEPGAFIETIGVEIVQATA